MRIDDWNDARFGDFLEAVKGMKREVENVSDDDSIQNESSTVSIRFADENGDVHEKTFPTVEPSRRARLLKSGILSCLDEMGGALSPEEKRQVVFDVLRGLC